MSRNGENESESNDSNPADDKTFINKLLIQMKSQFNKTQTDNTEVDVADISTMASQEENTNIETIETEEYEGASAKSETTDCEISEEDNSFDSQKDKPRIVLTFRKPSKPPRNRENSKETVLKRSSRRRSKDCGESVLQTAIARKEKSYNESNKPQRLTRQLKPTQKILDNIANAAVKLEKTKNKTDDNQMNSEERKSKSRLNHVKNSKRVKLSRDSDSDQSGQDVKLSDSNGSLSSESSKTSEEKLCRRSLRISSR